MAPLCAYLVLTAQLVTAISSSNNGIAEVKFVKAEFQGEEYRRLIEPMPQFVADAVTCPSTQVKPSSVVPSISNYRLSISTDLTLSNLT